MIRLEPLAEDGGSPETGVQDSARLRDVFLYNVGAGYAPFPCQIRDIRLTSSGSSNPLHRRVYFPSIECQLPCDDRNAHDSWKVQKQH